MPGLGVRGPAPVDSKIEAEGISLRTTLRAIHEYPLRSRQDSAASWTGCPAFPGTATGSKPCQACQETSILT